MEIAGGERTRGGCTGPPSWGKLRHPWPHPLQHHHGTDDAPRASSSLFLTLWEEEATLQPTPVGQSEPRTTRKLQMLGKQNLCSDLSLVVAASGRRGADGFPMQGGTLHSQWLLIQAWRLCTPRSPSSNSGGCRERRPSPGTP